MSLSSAMPHKLVIYPALDETRLSRVREIDGLMRIVNCDDLAQACEVIQDAGAFFGKISISTA